ncbi:MAG: hypothetical protein KGI73_04930 [Patescibacteria group bacterium]|nr:hypothetical protein [Patescibacteria group bacterium]
MQKFNTSIKNAGPVAVIFSVIVSVLFVVSVVQAATTIGSNISTDGTVSVTGLTTLGNASSTAFSVFNNAYFGATATSSFSSTGALTLTNALTYGGITLSNSVTGTGNMVLSASPTLTGLASMSNASSTLLSNVGTAYFGGTATTTIDSAGAVSAQKITIGGGTQILKHLSGTNSITFGTIAANSCSTGTITLTGAADGDSVYIGMPNTVASASSTLVWNGWVSAANTITVRLCQTAAQGTSPVAAATVRADVWQH